MSNNFLYILDKDLREKCRSRAEQYYHRNVDGDEEKIKYMGGSFMRVWYNMEDADFPLHWHYAIEIIVPLENTYTVVTQQHEYVLNPGDILIIPAGEVHELKAPKSGSRMVFLFDYTAISHLNGFSAVTPFLSQPVLIPKDEESTFYDHEIDLLSQIFMEFVNQGAFSELIIYSILLSFFVTLGKYRMMTSESIAENDTGKQQELAQKLAIAFDYLDSHYTEDVTLEDVAFVAGFSKFHFSRLFKQCSGQNFHEYLLLKRIKAAEMLLLRPDYSVTEIALQSGFSSLSTFNRTFKKIKNCSPTEYRTLCTKATTGSSLNTK